MLVTTLALCAAGTLVAFVPRPSLAVSHDPCSDSTYLELRSRSVDTLSDAEYRYLLQKGEECTESQKLRMLSSPPRLLDREGRTGHLSATRPRVDSSAGTFYVMGSFGLGYTVQGDLNSAIDQADDAFNAAGLKLKSRRFGPGFEFHAECGANISDILSLGLSVSHQKQVSNNTYSDISGRYQDKLTSSITEFVGTVSFTPSLQSQLRLGLSGGIGLGRLTEDYYFYIYGDPSLDVDGIGDWKGSAFVGSLFLQYTSSLDLRGRMRCRAGYKHRNLGAFEGTFRSPQRGTWTGAPQADSGRPLQIDYSGPFVALGIVFD